MARRPVAAALASPSARARVRAALVAALVLAAPLAVGAWALDRVAASSDRNRVDQALVETLGSAHRALVARLAQAQARATSVASETAVQAALLHGATSRLSELATERDVTIVLGARRVAGPAPGPLFRSATVVARGRQLGRVLVSLPAGPALVSELQRVSLVGSVRKLALVRGGRIVAADGQAVGAPVTVPAGRAATVRVGGVAYRALGVAAGTGSTRLLALAPRAPTEAAASRRRLWLVLAMLATLATAALAAAALAPVLRGALGRSGRGERRRARHAVTVIGEVLASTHDRERLLQVLLATTMEVTGAVGGRVLERGVAVREAGEPGGASAIELELDPDGETELLLYAPPGGFESGGTALARSIVAQGRIALENVRLHRLAEEQAVTDDLTGLANRRQFLYRLELELQRSERLDEPVAVVFADLDHFKDVNDRFGHDAGDDVLRAFAAVLRDHSRTIDLPARLGGEEFAVLLPGTDAAGAAAFAERVRATTAELRPRVTNGGVVRITASFGIASSATARTRQELLTAADAALYHAKAAGRNTVTTA